MDLSEDLLKKTTKSKSKFMAFKSKSSKSGLKSKSGLDLNTTSLLIGVMVCLLTTLWVQLSIIVGNGWPHNTLQHHANQLKLPIL